jgi:hypothetical protein
MTLLTIDELAAWLKLTKAQVYSLTRARHRARYGDKAIPVIRLHGSIRFSKESIEQWLKSLEEQ